MEFGAAPEELADDYGTCEDTISVTQLSGSERCSLNSCANLLESSVPGSRSVVGEGREATVVGGSNLFDGEEGHRFEDSIADLGRCLNHWIDRVDYADENKMLRTCKLAYETQHTLPVRFAGHLQIEPADIQLKSCPAADPRSRRLRYASNRSRRPGRHARQSCDVRPERNAPGPGYSFRRSCAGGSLKDRA